VIAICEKWCKIFERKTIIICHLSILRLSERSGRRHLKSGM
jgi:hypothetical protein